MENPWKTVLKWMIWGYHYFRKHPYRCFAFFQEHFSGSSCSFSRVSLRVCLICPPENHLTLKHVNVTIPFKSSGPYTTTQISFLFDANGFTTGKGLHIPVCMLVWFAGSGFLKGLSSSKRDQRFSNGGKDFQSKCGWSHDICPPLDSQDISSKHHFDEVSLVFRPL